MKPSTLVRSCTMAAGLMVLMLLFAPGKASAQFECACDHITVVVSADVGCRVPFCVRTYGPTECDSLAPGTRTVFRCIGIGVPYLIDCNNQVAVPPLGGCIDVPLAGGCCVQACLDYDANKCWQITIRPAKCACP